MSSIIPFNREETGLTRLPRGTSRALERVEANGLVSAAKVQSTAFVAHVALSQVGLLSIEEALLVERTPHAAGRARLIVDSFTTAAANELVRLGYRS